MRTEGLNIISPAIDTHQHLINLVSWFKACNVMKQQYQIDEAVSHGLLSGE